MKVPLSVETIFPAGEPMKLRIVHDGKVEEVAPPFRPYVYAENPLPGYTGTPHTFRPLGTRQPQTLWKYEFDTTLPVAQLNAQYERGAAMARRSGLIDSHVRFQERVAIDRPDFYGQYAHVGPVRPLILDTEGLTKAGKSLNKHWIGMLTSEGEVVQIELEEMGRFCEILKAHDVVVGFNINGYDWPIIQAEVARQGVTLPLTFTIYDVGTSAQRDQTLSGIKGRGLKNVARWYGMTVTEIDGRNTVNYSLKELLDYNVSDLRATRGLYDIYFPSRIQFVAEYMGLPLNVIAEEFASTAPSVMSARGLLRKGWISDGTNAQRHPNFRKSVEGAHVELLCPPKTLSGWTLKLDFRQLYPSIIQALNLGADTTWIIGYEPLGPYRAEHDGVISTYYIPDENIGQTIVVRVDESEPSINRVFLDDLGLKREEIKSQRGGMPEAEWLRHPLHAQENGIKVIRNALYGYQLSHEARYSDLATGIVVTGTGRLLIRAVVDAVAARFGAIGLEVDTDGVYFATEAAAEVAEFAQEALNEYAQRIIGKTGFVLERQVFKASYFIAAKGYILMDERGQVIIHGSGQKGTHRPMMEDKVLTDVASKLLAGEPVNPRPYYNWDRYTLPEDVLMRQGAKKDISEYRVEATGKQIMEQYLRHGEPVQIGATILEYFHSVSGSRAFFAEEFVPTDVDREYYEDKLDKLFKKFGIDPNAPLSIEATARRAEVRLERAVARGVYEPCVKCGQKGEYLPRGKIMPITCGDCEGKGRRLVMEVAAA
jgi:DNA polymerase elongation subunit (family B)